MLIRQTPTDKQSIFFSWLRNMCVQCFIIYSECHLFEYKSAFVTS